MHPDSHRLLAARSEEVDTIVRALAAEYLEPGLLFPFSVVAVGGYGRSELFPQSDVDLVLLVEKEPDLPTVKEPLALFLRELWDRGLKASQSVRTVAECLRLQEQNIELHISLLDARCVRGSHVSGGADTFAQLEQQLPDFYLKHEARFTRELAMMTRRRHSKFNDTVYHLEPNVKEAPGGIRDIHFLHWLALLAQERGAVRETLAASADSREFLYAVRCFLHQRSHRDNNLLSFETQDCIAQSWDQAPLDPAAWMRLYYRHARRVYHSALKALEFAERQTTPLARQFREWRGRLSNADFTVSQERVLLRNPAATMASAGAVLELFTFLGRHGLPLSWDANRRLVAHHAALSALFQSADIPWPAWREFFAQPHVALALREMQECGLLAAAIPGWPAVECLVVRDFYHRYTVDEHSIVAVEVIDRLTAKDSPLPARMRTLLQEDDQAPVLRLALLLHDVGKGITPGDHVRGSLEASEAVFRQLNVPEAARAIIRFLIGHHLDLSTVMHGRDLDDPATARFLTSRAGTLEDLRRLTLLTFADISAVNPTAMTPWRLEQLWRVYLSGQEQLTRELIDERIGGEAGETLEPDLLDFLRGFPKRYLRTHSAVQIRHHRDLEHKRRLDGSGIAVEVSHDSGVYLLTVIADDKPGHFASICGALASCGMNILKAEAASNDSGCYLDLIRFGDPMRTLELNPGEIPGLERTVRGVLEGALRVTDLLKRRRAAPLPSSGSSLSPSVRFNNEASDYCTLIDFSGEDRPGLLYDLTSAISAAGCNIELVLVDTEAHKAMDVFYVTERAGKLSPEAQAGLAKALAQAVSVK